MTERRRATGARRDAALANPTVTTDLHRDRDPNGPPRLVVFTGDLSYSVRRTILEIDGRHQGALHWLIVEQRPRKTLRQLLRSQRLNLRRHGWRWVPYQVGDVMRRVGQALARPPAASPIGAELSRDALSARPSVTVEVVDDLHAPSTIDRVAAFRPTLGLSLAAPILRRALFSVPRMGTINLHKGRLPDYRGMPPAFWEFWNDADSVGCSVHVVDDGLDSGAVLARDEVRRPAHATVRGVQLRLDDVGNELMVSAVHDLLAGRLQPVPQPAGAGATYRKPTLAQERALARKLASRHPESASDRTRRLVKSGVGTGLAAAQSAGLLHWRAPRVTVLLYHRVSDDARDNLTVGVEQFERQMTALRRHCDVLPIEQVLSLQPIPRSRRPQVAVTFDDGYLDNFIHAAPILRRVGIPCAFYVATGIVDTADAMFPHDVRRGNRHIPVMTWDQMRLMQRWGFTFGSHSVTHMDCASAPEAQVRDELARSKQTLKSELGVTDPVFAYPYGGRQHMTPERLELVKAAGYVGCLSAYGGTNVHRVDRFNVLRRGIHHGFSDRAFMTECLGL